MLWAVGWKLLFSALKISKIPFFERFSWLTCVDIFFSSGTKVRCVENSVFLTFCIRGFFYSPQSYMINVLKINCALLPSRVWYYECDHRPQNEFETQL